MLSRRARHRGPQRSLPARRPCRRSLQRRGNRVRVCRVSVWFCARPTDFHSGIAANGCRRMNIEKFTPNVPPSCRVCGFIYSADDRRQLSEDMLDVILPNGLLVTAGWYPEGDQNGHYWVAAHRGLQEVMPAIESETAAQAIVDVEQLVAELIGRGVLLPRSGIPQTVSPLFSVWSDATSTTALTAPMIVHGFQGE